MVLFPYIVNRLSTWYEDSEEYEGNLEEMATANLDQSFQDELQHVNQWFGFLTDAEKTAALYTLLQHSSQVQIRFFIHMLQDMRRPNPLTRGSERASNIMNLSNRRLSSINQQQSRVMNNRHSFALGDTQELSRIFGSMGSSWLNTDEAHALPPRPTTSVSRTPSHLRPKSVMELGGTSPFSNSWLNQRQPNMFTTPEIQPAIERPRSADISSWNLPSSSSSQPPWKPLGNQHDIDFQPQWRDNPVIQHSQPATHFSTLDDTKKQAMPTRQTNYGQYLAAPKAMRSTSIDNNDGLLGYGSDPGDSSRYRSTPAGNISLHGKPKSAHEEVVDIELLKDVPAWFRSMRLHKYNNIFEKMKWQDIVKLNDQELQEKGVAALGARRKMLKVFESIRDYCRAHQIDY
ncbi:Flap-structured DNA-binding and RNA-binding protein [Rhizopus stolonifer]|uniref:Flap-structured DNA-binding and RNA-binding protein n=1 Tax=Rhizopus stolonifer TaxID=4846 RepID=A0A367KTN9_RHIST|nr:Flap-structured DNA-binding and RNA-binding protein [Rhizopus stolonifer]